jgi:MoaA/NifB/PqqE/SkfB family radical SAM enzyme
MYKYSDITSIHLEITSKCQARCPQCPRRIQGGPINPFIVLEEITLDQFKSWFDIEFIKQLNSLFMCGNLGDPIVATSTLEIFEYLRNINPTIELSMFTNGSARNSTWWSSLAKLNVTVVFGIDGLSDTHSLYRVGTDFDEIIRHATEFIQAGGIAKWDMLVFKHNEHQVDDCKALSGQLGFKDFRTKHTSRFVDDSLDVLDNHGSTTHIIYPTGLSKSMIKKVMDAQEELNPEIKCKAQENKSIYISSNGNISPCCWLDLEWYQTNHKSRVDYMNKIGVFPNLNKNSLKEIFESGFFEDIKNTWEGNCLRECAKQCGSFNKLKEQYTA